jgi:hypothetical protein
MLNEALEVHNKRIGGRHNCIRRGRTSSGGKGIGGTGGSEGLIGEETVREGFGLEEGRRGIA